jgi:esterase/lipase
MGNCYDFLNTISKHNRINILAVEYPGYGIYNYKNGKECSAEEIIKDADFVYNFLINAMKIKQENLIVFGRCLGSGPAIYLSYTYKPKCLILMSAFTSLKDAAKSVFEKYKLGWFCEKIIRER